MEEGSGGGDSKSADFSQKRYRGTQHRSHNMV
jgi:hypothetical protein